MPVGAIIVGSDGNILAAASNLTITDIDPTAHAEVTAIREACAALQTFQLDDCELYTSCEPCPMCLAACHYAGIGRIVCGAPIAAMQAITGSELLVSPVALFAAQAGKPLITHGVLAQESQALLDKWRVAQGAQQDGR